METCGGSGSTGLTSYMAGNSLGFDEDDSASAAPSRTFSLFGGGKKAGKEKAPKVELPPNWKKAKDKDGRTPAQYAAVAGHTEAFEVLARNGADLDGARFL